MENNKNVVDDISKELAESFERAEDKFRLAKIDNNEKDKNFWKGELSVLHRLRRLIPKDKKDPIEILEEALDKTKYVYDEKTLGAVIDNDEIFDYFLAEVDLIREVDK